jgi:DNA-binding LytR/AlgR family response regulator
MSAQAPDPEARPQKPAIPARNGTLRAIIVDDEPLARDELTFLLAQCDGIEVVGEASSPADAERLCGEQRPELAFVDLRMPGLDGLSLARILRKEHPSLDVVIISAHDYGAVRAFDAPVTDYLPKPVPLQRLRRALDRVLEARADSASSCRLQRFAVRRKGSYVVVELGDVIYFEARDELVWAVTEKDRFAVDWTVAALAERLDDDVFFRSHRSYLVRIDRIRSIEPTGARSFRLVLQHPESPRVPLARDRVGTLRRRIPFSR